MRHLWAPDSLLRGRDLGHQMLEGLLSLSKSCFVCAPVECCTPRRAWWLIQAYRPGGPINRANAKMDNCRLLLGLRLHLRGRCIAEWVILQNWPQYKVESLHNWVSNSWAGFSRCQIIYCLRMCKWAICSTQTLQLISEGMPLDWKCVFYYVQAFCIASKSKLGGNIRPWCSIESCSCSSRYINEGVHVEDAALEGMGIP